jgi:hypothetical protein
MNKTKLTILVLIGTLLSSSFFFTSCEVDYLSDPNKPEVVPTYGLMNRVQKRIMDDTRDEWFSGRQALLWIQYWNQVNYTEEDRYQYRETTNQGGWDDLYGNAQDLRDILLINDASEIPNPNEIAGARIMLCYIYSLAAEVWGDVPYYSYGSDNPDFQANSMKDKGIFTPVYASQQEIYADILNELKESVAMIDGPVFPNGDNFFGGEPDQWIKFANSLRLRIANRIKDVYPPAVDIIAEVSANVMSSNADNAGVTYEANALNAAPMYRAFYVQNRTDFAPSFSFVELLKGNRGPFGADPRLGIFADENKDGFILGVPLTSANSEVVAFTWESLPGKKVLSLTYTEIYMEYAEVCFLLSENNGWDQDWYEKGVRASMERWGVDEAAIAEYINNLPAASEETVLTQKYIALYMQPYEAWSEYRRTGYPKTLIMPNETYDYSWQYLDSDGGVVDTTATYTFTPIGGLTDLPARIKYLTNEASVNDVNVSNAAASIGGDEQSTKLWWAE